jgi:hypothetical protein
VSNPLAIAAVTAALRNLLDEVATAFPGTDITAMPPVRARPNEARTQLNLYLYHTRPNIGWRNTDLPGQARPGETGFPPLAIDLYYLITAYGREGEDLEAHQVLGQAMSVLHDHPVLGRQELRDALPGSDVHTQIERIRIAPEPLSVDDLFKLWSAFQTEYRISAAYQVTVLLIESQRATRTPLPVLSPHVGAQASLVPPFPTITEIEPQNGQPSARLGETLTIRGHHLAGTGHRVLLTNERLGAPLELAPIGTPTDTELRVSLPNDASAQTNWVAGVYRVAVHVTPPGEPTRVTGERPFALAPLISIAPPSPVSLGGGTSVTVTVTSRPETRAEQRVSLLMGHHEIRPASSSGADVQFGVALAPGEYLARLRVDGVDSLLVDHTVTPPAFLDAARVTIVP